MNCTCSPTGNFTDDSAYGKNLAELLSTTLSPPAKTAVDNWWFRSGTVGAASGVAMCYADSDAQRCRSCLATAAQELTFLCSHSRNASFLSSDGCVVRYADAPFFGTAGTDGDTALFMRNLIIDGASMRETRQALLSQLAERAGDDDGLRFAAGKQGYVDFLRRRRVMYGMAQCTRDLPLSACTGCLFDHLATMYKHVEMTNSTGAAVMGLSCYLTYQLDTPIDFAGLAQPPSPAPAHATAESPTRPSAPPLLVGKTTTLFAALLAAAAGATVTLLNVVASV